MNALRSTADQFGKYLMLFPLALLNWLQCYLYLRFWMVPLSASNRPEFEIDASHAQIGTC